jgi:hypothetical protein
MALHFLTLVYHIAVSRSRICLYKLVNCVVCMRQKVVWRLLLHVEGPEAVFMLSCHEPQSSRVASAPSVKQGNAPVANRVRFCHLEMEAALNKDLTDYQSQP